MAGYVARFLRRVRGELEMYSIQHILTELEREKFYGSVEVKFEAGKVVILRKTETIKPSSENYRNNRGNKNERKQS